MKARIILFVLAMQFIGLFQSLAQVIDTLVDVTGHKLHFTIWKGKGIPILFEASGGNDGSVWQSIL